MSTGIPKEPKYKIMDQGSSERGIKRVLVLSHMFPHEGRTNLGCFVSEQVKALREFGGIDARVISCQPFLRDVTVYSLPFYWMQALYSYRRQVHEAEWFLHDGIPTLFVPYLVGFPFEFHSMAYLQAVRMIAARIKKVFDFELVHAHTGYLDGIAGRYLARRFKVPFVITEHTGPFSLLTDRPVVRAITLKSMAAADRIICVSPALEGQVKKWLPAKIHDRFAVIPNGVNIELFHPASADRKGIPHKTLDLLSVMSLDENKNPLCLMKAFKILREKGHDCRLTIAGDGPLMSELREWITDNGYDDRIDLLGWQNRETIARLMREECDIFVLPSRSETFGVVVIEALASGKPVVSTRCGGPESIMTVPYLGELCDNDNAESLATAIEKVAGNPEGYPGDAIRKFAEANYSYEKLAGRLSELYEECSGKGVQKI